MSQQADEGTSVTVKLSIAGGFLGAIAGARDGPVGAAIGGALGGTTGYALGQSLTQDTDSTDSHPVAIEITDPGTSSSTTRSSE